MRLIITILFVLTFGSSFAQKGTVTSTGNNDSTKTQNVSWTIGGTIVGTSQTSKYNVNTGNILTPYQIIYDEDGNIELDCYPNPSTDKIKIILHSNDFEGYSWTLYNIQGQAIKTGLLKSNSFIIKVSELQASMYILNIYDTDNDLISNAKLIRK